MWVVKFYVTNQSQKSSTVIAGAAQKSMKPTELEQREIRDKKIVIFGVKEGSTKQDTIERVQNIITDYHLSRKSRSKICSD